MKLFLLPHIDKPLGSMSEVKVLADNVLTNSGHDIYLQEWMGAVSFSPILLWRVGKVGKCIGPKFISRYLDKATIGISLKAEGGESWVSEQMRVGFDDSIIRSDRWWGPDNSMVNDLSIRVVDKELMIDSGIDSLLLVPPFEAIGESVALLSQYFLLKIGDLIAFPLWQQHQPVLSEQGIFIVNNQNEELLFCGIK